MFQIESISLNGTQISVTNRINAFVSGIVNAVKSAFAAPVLAYQFA